MNKIITEITPLSDCDCFYLVDRRKDYFDYPIHRHDEYEVNFVANCAGCRRIAGDSDEVLGYYDLAIIGPKLEHGWEQNGVKQNGDMHEVTVQFSPGLLGENFLMKNQMNTIRVLLEESGTGVAFGQDFIASQVGKIEQLVSPQPGFLRFLKLLEFLYDMSVTTDRHRLSTTSFANVEYVSDSRRVRRVQEYINANYRQELRLSELASLAGMAPTAFSRFFRTRTGRTVSDYIIDMRIGHAARLLLDTTMTSAEICFECGFNNISNFNRLFRKKRNCSPMEFRANYLKTKIII